MSVSTRIDAPTPQVTTRMVELACLAPSIHNTQPWAWRLSGVEAWLYADLDRQLRVEDPQGRNLVISCGAALHHFQLAARALGWSADVERIPDPDNLTALAHVRLRRDPRPDQVGVLDALRTRCTDRRRFTSWPVPPERLETLCEVALEREAAAVPVLDLAARFRIEQTVRQTLELPDRDPQDIRPEVESSDGLIVLGGVADDRLSWLRTGEALSALWIRATRTGLSVVPLSEPLDLPSIRTELRAQLANASEPHLLVRVGWQAIGRSGLPSTPRRPVDQVLRA